MDTRKSFAHLREVSRYFHGQWPSLDRVDEWSEKRQMLAIQLLDVPFYARAFAGRAMGPDAVEPRITVSSHEPALRLAVACEAASNLVYGMAEIAANLANSLASGSFACPKSFNSLTKKVAENDVPTSLRTALGDLQWYARVREMRTEWTHYSTPFVAHDGQEVILIIRGFRNRTDRVHIRSNAPVRVSELVQWSQAALETLDRFAGWILSEIIVPQLAMETSLSVLVQTPSGLPTLDAAGGIETREMTVREMLIELGVLVPDRA